MGERLPDGKQGRWLQLRQGPPARVREAVGQRLGRGCDAGATVGGCKTGGGLLLKTWMRDAARQGRQGAIPAAGVSTVCRRGRETDQ